MTPTISKTSKEGIKKLQLENIFIKTLISQVWDAGIVASAIFEKTVAKIQGNDERGLTGNKKRAVRHLSIDVIMHQKLNINRHFQYFTRFWPFHQVWSSHRL